MFSHTYVVGHVNPDTDSIASAIGYSWLLKERDQLKVIPARAGALNQQTKWLLDYLKIDVPILLTDASPRFESVAKKIETTTPDKPLHVAWNIASKNKKIAPIVNLDGSPYGLVTHESLFNLMIKLVEADTTQHQIKVREILDLPCSEAADKNIQSFLLSARIKDYIKKILWSEANIFWVVDSEGKYVGILHQRDLLNPPRLKIILVDHNETHQAVPSLDEAELIEIIDHHRLGNSSTISPIQFSVEPVGSTSTLITERIKTSELEVPPKIALLLMGGIISDTLNLISPTTTPRDKDAINYLAQMAFKEINLFDSKNTQSFAQKLLSSGTGLNTRSPQEIIESDIKFYSEGSIKFAISQAEVTTNLYEITYYFQTLKNALVEIRQRNGLNFAGLMVTDIVRGSSIIILDNPPVILDDLPFTRTNEGAWFAQGLVSRKKQLIPLLLSLIKG
jgi:manganese-dependent inorganic pyrophosphatase